MMNTDQAEKLMGLWRRFVEPLFGVRRAGAENHGLVDSAAEAAAVAVAEEAKKEELAQRDGNLERAAAGDKATAAAEEGGAGGAADMEAEKVDSRAGEAGTEKPERGAAAAAAGLEEAWIAKHPVLLVGALCQYFPSLGHALLTRIGPGRVRAARSGGSMYEAR